MIVTVYDEKELEDCGSKNYPEPRPWFDFE